MAFVLALVFQIVQVHKENAMLLSSDKIDTVGKCVITNDS